MGKMTSSHKPDYLSVSWRHFMSSEQGCSICLISSHFATKWENYWMFNISLGIRKTDIKKNSEVSYFLLILPNSSQSWHLCVQVVQGRSNSASKFGSDWPPQIGQIWEFLRSVSVHFGSREPKIPKLIYKKSKIFRI